MSEDTSNNGILFIARYFKHYRKFLLLGAVVAFIETLIILPIPLINRHIIDNMIPSKEVNGIFILSGVWLLIVITNLGLSLIYRYLISRAGLTARLVMLPDLIKTIIRMPMLKMRSKHSIETLHRVWNDSLSIQELFVEPVISTTINLLKLIFGIGIIFYLNWKLSLVALILVPFYLLISIHSGKKIKDLYKKINKNAEEQGIIFYEAVIAQAELKVLDLEDYWLNRLSTVLKKVYVDDVQQVLIEGVSLNLTSLVSTTMQVIVIGYGSLQIIQGYISIGDLIAFQAFYPYLFGPISLLVKLYQQANTAKAASERLSEILLEEVEDPESGDNAIITKGSISVSNVSFSYDDRTKVLKEINLNIDHGENVAIVGKSGVGKSTLIHIIAGLIRDYEGTVFIDGHDIIKTSLKALRKKIGVIQQNPYIFYGTIEDNLRYVKPDCSDVELQKVIRLANLDDFIKKSPQGLKTLVGEMGMKLSGGERQRLAIARILLKDPVVVILDEATSSIDSTAENMIYEALKELGKNRTMIIIAHRLSSIMMCDKIFLIEDGKVCGIGNHSELYNHNYKYRQLCDEQFSVLNQSK